MRYVTWADLALGVWLIAFPLAFGYSTSRPIIVAEDLAPGFFLIATALWVLTLRVGRIRVNWLQMLGGLWLLAGSFALMFSHLSYAGANGLIVGILVLATSLAASTELLRESKAG